MSAAFANVAEKVRGGERLNDADGLVLFEHDDLLELGNLADEVNRRKNRDVVFYNVNRHINPTNICVKSCKFCAFSRKPGEEGAYEYSLDDILEKAGTVVAQGATEVHMVGGLHPRWSFQKFIEIISALKTTYPSLHIKAFTAVEIDWLAAKARLTIRDTLLALKEAGLGSIPGGGAEIFHPEIRLQICDTKTDAARWLEIHRTAHNIGLRSNCTMLYGHIEKYRHRVDHMRRLRELQDETRGFNVFIPLAFQPYDNDMGITRYTPGAEDLRTIAVARLFLDNFQHIKSYWIMLGQDIAQLALNFGANDLDGTVTEEKISHMAGGRGGMAMSRNQIHSIVYKAHRQPVERDTLYNPIKKFDLADSGGKIFSDETVAKILYKAEQGELLKIEEADALASAASLFQLGHCARVARARALPEYDDKKLAIATQTVLKIDLKSEEYASLQTIDQFIAYLKNVRTESPDLSVSVHGIKGIWSFAKKIRQPVLGLLTAMAEAGVDCVESAGNESEADLTNSEVVSFHRDCHSVGLRTVAKVEIAAAYSGRDIPFWDGLIRRTLEFNKLQAETNGLLAVKVEAAKDSFITPCEYFRSVALTRVLAMQIPHILVPFTKIPTIKGRTAKELGQINDPALKLAPLALYFGASDLDTLPASAADPKNLMDEMHVTGLQLGFRNARFESLNLL